MEKTIIKFLDLTYPGEINFKKHKFLIEGIYLTNDSDDVVIGRINQNNKLYVNHIVARDIIKWLGELSPDYINECFTKWFLIKYNSKTIEEVVENEYWDKLH